MPSTRADPAADRPTATPLPARPPRLLSYAALGGAAIALFLILAVTLGHAPFAWDRAILLGLRDGGDLSRPLGPTWLRRAFIDITALGDGTVLTAIVLIVIGLLLVLRRWRSAALVLAATWSGSLLAAQAKLWVGRPRPDLVDHLVPVTGLSFPSGHATNSAIIYLTLASLVAQIEHGRALRCYTLAVALLLVGLIGASRVYLGVHWPSDVLAGWCLGSLWAFAWWWIGVYVRGGAGPRPTSPRGSAPPP